VKTADELAPLLTVHQTTPGQYVLRVSDLKWRDLTVGIAKLLPDAKSLVLITPLSIKVLRVGSVANEASPAPVAKPERNAGNSADPKADAIAREYRDAGIELDQETLDAIAAQEGHAPPGDPPPAPSLQDPEAAEAAEAAEAGMRVVRRTRSNGTSGHPETCGRCRGAGTIRIIEEGGGAGEAPCAVCQGSGVIQRYGLRR